MSRLNDFIKLAVFVISRKKIQRTVNQVEDEYTTGWNMYRNKLENSATIEDWLNDNDGTAAYYNVEGKFSKQVFDSSDFYRKTFLNAFEKHYPDAKSVAEFGCGVGRNLIYLHKHYSNVKLYGFELCKPGVELANKAAQKFNLPIQYFQLDYLNWIPSHITIPNIDVGFTIFSLEQIPDDSLQALNNIMSRVNMGTFHLEPVVENYPWTIRGIIGRIDHYKVGYLNNFEKNARKVVGDKNINRQIYNTAHNPLMYPSLYILKKNQ